MSIYERKATGLGLMDSSTGANVVDTPTKEHSMSTEAVPAVSITLTTPTYTASFALENDEVIEALHDMPDGTADWENGAICDARGDSPEMVAAIRTALLIATDRYS